MQGERGGGVRWAAALALLLGCRAPAPVPAVASPMPVETVVRATTEPTTDGSTSLEARLDLHAVGADDFVRLDLYTWTTPPQIEALRAGGPLLVADATAGDGPSPYHRLLAAMDEEHRPGHALASILRHTPALSRCRYAWPSPMATVLGLGPQR